MNRREWLMMTTAASGALLLPNVTGLLGAQGTAQAPTTATPVMTLGRERLLADFGWHFHLGHADDPVKDFGYGRGSGIFSKSGSLMGGRGNPTAPTFDETSWTPVDLPHDWAVDLPFVSDGGVNGHGAKPLGRAYPETSIGWYRRTFDIPATDLGRRIAFDFDGVFRDCIVILNNHYIGRNLSGYTPFRFDVTDFLNYGGKNTLVVRVDATEGEGWFYEGAGIYRHVWLEKTSPIHIAPNGVFVRTTEVTDTTATLAVDVEVVNESDQPKMCRLAVIVANQPFSTLVARPLPLRDTVTLAPWQRHTFSETLKIGVSPRIWSIESPNLSWLVTQVIAADANDTLDAIETPFGICTRRWDPDKGFFLNGKHVEIKGTCNHQDHAGVGSGLPDALQDFRIAKLKEMGCNAYRTSHNPPTPELLDACDRLGMLVLDETRMMSSNEEGLSELERLVKRDRNHPSVFCWSIGNEEPEQATDRGAREVTTMKRLVNQLDGTRLVTEAMNNSWGRGLSSVVDVQGFNYHTGVGPTAGKEMDDYHAAHAKQPTMGTETASTVSTRGIYANDKDKGYVSAYDRNFPAWASTAENWWSTYAARPYVAGGFVWTGFDYRGEPTPYGWPCISSHFGILDMCGFPKDLFWYYQAWWTDKPVLHLFPHWNWAGKEGQEVEVWCFSNLDSVELFVNGTSVGSKPVAKNSHVEWKMPYAPGVIEARGTKDGKVALTDKRETTGPASKIVLKPDRAKINADGEDVSCTEVQIVDAQGRIVPVADNEVTFNVTGGRLIGVGNGDPSSHEPDRVKPGAPDPWKRHAFNGLCMAIVQAPRVPGDIRVDATSPGLGSGSVIIRGDAATPRLALG